MKHFQSCCFVWYCHHIYRCFQVTNSTCSSVLCARVSCASCAVYYNTYDACNSPVWHFQERLPSSVFCPSKVTTFVEAVYLWIQSTIQKRWQQNDYFNAKKTAVAGNMLSHSIVLWLEFSLPPFILRPFKEAWLIVYRMFLWFNHFRRDVEFCYNPFCCECKYNIFKTSQYNF